MDVRSRLFLDLFIYSTNQNCSANMESAATNSRIATSPLQLKEQPRTIRIKWASPGCSLVVVRLIRSESCCSWRSPGW